MSKIKLSSLCLCFVVFCTAVYAQPIVSIVHNDVNTLDRATPTNLIANGSFETGGPSTGNPVSYFWTRPCNNAKVPPGWASNSDLASYGWWGYFQSGDGSQYQNPVCDITLQTLIDAQMLAPAGNSNNLLYFGNYELTAGPPVPAYNAATGEYIPRAGVAAANTAINWVLGVLTPTSPVILSQDLTGLTAGCYYELEFWVTGEQFGGPDGIFDLQIGAKHFWLTCPGPDNQHNYGTDERYHIVFQAAAATQTIAFKSYGHFNIANNPNMATWFTTLQIFSSELALDDVIVNQKCITVSGNIWLDNDQSQTINNGEPNYLLGNHYVNLVGPDGKILYSALVDATGSYSFPAPMNTAGLSIQISTSAAALEANPNTPVAPTGYSNTTPVSIPLTTVTTNIVNQDFGIKFGILPITTGDFKGVLKDNIVVLNWLTYSELNAAYFEIEKSDDLSFTTNFVKIGRVNAAGNTSATKEYSFTETKDNSKISFYRLKMVDNNGAFKYSNTIAIRRNSKDVFVYALSPNPFTNFINLGIKMSAKGAVNISLSDLSGRKLITQKVTLSNGENNFNVTGLGQLPKGIYILDITNETDVMRYKVLKN